MNLTQENKAFDICIEVKICDKKVSVDLSFCQEICHFVILYVILLLHKQLAAAVLSDKYEIWFTILPFGWLGDFTGEVIFVCPLVYKCISWFARDA